MPEAQSLMSAFVPMPMSFGNWQRQSDYHGNEVPARVRVALDFLTNLTLKTMTRGMVNDIAMQEIEGQELQVEERQAQHEAHKMLKDYFAGVLYPSQWEIMMHQSNQPQVAVIDCPHCGNGDKKTTCVGCEGKGKVIVKG